MRSRRSLGGGVALLLALGGGACHGGPKPQVAPAARDFLVDPHREAVARQLIQRADAARVLSGDRASRAILLPALAPSSRVWDAAALTWAMLRLGPALTPRDVSVPSVPALQAWLRRDDPASVVAWMLELRDGDPSTVELVVATAETIWRSGEVQLPVRPLAAEPVDLTPVASLEVEEPADALRLEDGILWLESRWGRREVRLRDDRFELGDLRGWSTFDRSWTERPDPGDATVPVLFAPSGDRRLELRPTAEGNHTELRWWAARAGGELPLAPPLRLSERWLALETWLLRASTWIVLSEAGDTRRLTALRIPLRAVPSARARPAPSPSVPVVWVEGGPVDPDPWPRDRWSLWVRAHTAVSLARRAVGDAVARPEPDVAFHAKMGSRVWEVTLPALTGHGASEGISPADWRRGLTARLQGEVPTRYAWLVEPLAGTIRTTSMGLRLEFERPVPDLIERLAHPVLALDDPALARRFTTHRWEPPSLVPRGNGAVVQLRPQVPAALGPALRQAALATVGERAARDQRHRAVDAVLLCSAAAPVELRRCLAWALRDVSVDELLALDDPALDPVAPASRRSRASIWEGVTAPVEHPLRLALLPIDPRDDPDGELLLAQRRLEILLPARGIGFAPPSASRGEGVVLAQLVRIALYTGEPLLRVLELESWAGAGPGRETTRQAAWRDLGDERRHQAARDAERTLLVDGALVPLWAEPTVAEIDTSVTRVGPWLEGLPVMCEEIAVAEGSVPQ